MSRERMTWQGREASAPPATPGYNVEDQDHPAHRPDPAHEEYAQGDPDAWAETPKAPPYPQGNPPASPGYGVEDKDHPAHSDPPRNPQIIPKEASLKELVQAKAAKCLHVARLMLKGKEASVIEDQALDMMDWSDGRLASTADRLGGGFLAEIPPPPGVEAQDDLDAILSQEVQEPVDACGNPMAAKFAAMEAKIARLERKLANQNDPNGPTLALEEEEETASRKAARAFFASMDTDGDGFVARADWTASPALFTAADKDEDDIVTEEEVVEEIAPKEDEEEKEEKEGGKKACKKADDDDKDDGGDEGDDDAGEETETASRKAARAFFASMDTDGDGFVARADWTAAPALFTAADKDEDDIVTEEEVVEEIAPKEEKEDGEGKEGKKALLNFAVGQDKAPLAPAPTACAPMDTGIQDQIDEAGMFSLPQDPMMGGPTPEDDAILAEIFGKAAKKEGGEEEEVAEEDEPVEGHKKGQEEDVEEGKEGKKAMARVAAQRPQPRKPSTGVRSVGQVQRTAADTKEMDELSSIWKSEPDVSGVFGN